MFASVPNTARFVNMSPEEYMQTVHYCAEKLYKLEEKKAKYIDYHMNRHVGFVIPEENTFGADEPIMSFATYTVNGKETKHVWIQGAMLKLDGPNKQPQLSIEAVKKILPQIKDVKGELFVHFTWGTSPACVHDKYVDSQEMLFYAGNQPGVVCTLHVLDGVMTIMYYQTDRSNFFKLYDKEGKEILMRFFREDVASCGEFFIQEAKFYWGLKDKYLPPTEEAAKAALEKSAKHFEEACKAAIDTEHMSVTHAGVVKTFASFREMCRGVNQIGYDHMKTLEKPGDMKKHGQKALLNLDFFAKGNGKPGAWKSIRDADFPAFAILQFLAALKRYSSHQESKAYLDEMASLGIVTYQEAVNLDGRMEMDGRPVNHGGFKDGSWSATSFGVSDTPFFTMGKPCGDLNGLGNSLLTKALAPEAKEARRFLGLPEDKPLSLYNDDELTRLMIDMEILYHQAMGLMEEPEAKRARV